MDILKHLERLGETNINITEKYDNQSVNIINDTSVSGLEKIFQEVSSDSCNSVGFPIYLSASTSCRCSGSTFSY